MTSLLDIVLFIAIIALLYFILLSRYGWLAHRIRERQNRHDQTVRELKPYSESKDARSHALDERASDRSSASPDGNSHV